MFKSIRRIIIATSLLLVFLLPFALQQNAFAQSDSTSGDIVVQTIPGPTVAEKIATRTKTSWPWYLARGSGLMAAILLVILLLSGIGMVTGYTFRFLEPLTAWASHRAIGIAFGVSVLIHMFSLLFDHFAPFNIWQILIPWKSGYQPVTIFGHHFGSLYVALGVLAFYLLILVIVTSLLWVEKRPHLWKIIHLLSYVIILFVFVHALYLGTDLLHGILRWVWVLSGVSIGIAIVHRLWRAKTT